MKKQDSIDVIGSVFGIWHNDVPGPIQESSLLRPGNEQVAASYIVYGTSTVLVAATRESVQGFTLDNASGEFMLTHPGAIPKSASTTVRTSGSSETGESLYSAR